MSSNHFDLGHDAAYYVWISSFNDLSTTVVLYYDYFLTLPREIQFLWPPHNKQGWFTLACFINRYIPLIGVLPLAISYFIKVNPTVCGGLHTYHEWFMFAGQMQASTLCLLRVHALYGRSRHILGLLLSLGAGTIVCALVSIYLIRKSGGEPIQVVSTFGGCTQYTPQIGGRFAALAWAGALVFDGVIFSLTLYKAFKIGRGVKLLNVIVRDGTMYFSALSVMNLGNIMTLLFAPIIGVLIAPTSSVATILINRLVLNLRERAAEQLPTTVESAGEFKAALPDGLTTAAVKDIRSNSLGFPTNQADSDSDGVT